MKTLRQEKILEIIAKQNIETQNEIMQALSDCGMKSTQATISRDIKDLRLVKELLPDGGYRYVSPSRDNRNDYDSRLRKIFKESVTSCAEAQNIVVIKTLTGLAPAVCYAFDGMSIPNLVGTLAGEDTAFLAMTDSESAIEFINEINAMLR